MSKQWCLEMLSKAGMVQLVGVVEGERRYAFTDLGTRSLRHVHKCASPSRFFMSPSELANIPHEEWSHCSNWELLQLLKQQGWSLRKLPPPKILKRHPLPPHTSESLEKQQLLWYLSSVTLQKSKAYMLALLSSERLFGTSLAEIHHGMSVKYYERILDGTSDGRVAQLSIEDSEPVLKLLSDVAEDPVPLPDSASRPAKVRRPRQASVAEAPAAPIAPIPVAEDVQELLDMFEEASEEAHSSDTENRGFVLESPSNSENDLFAEPLASSFSRSPQLEAGLCDDISGGAAGVGDIELGSSADAGSAADCAGSAADGAGSAADGALPGGDPSNDARGHSAAEAESAMDVDAEAEAEAADRIKFEQLFKQLVELWVRMSWGRDSWRWKQDHGWEDQSWKRERDDRRWSESGSQDRGSASSQSGWRDWSSWHDRDARPSKPEQPVYGGGRGSGSGGGKKWPNKDRYERRSAKAKALRSARGAAKRALLMDQPRLADRLRDESSESSEDSAAAEPEPESCEDQWPKDPRLKFRVIAVSPAKAEMANAVSPAEAEMANAVSPAEAEMANAVSPFDADMANAVSAFDAEMASAGSPAKAVLARDAKESSSSDKSGSENGDDAMSWSLAGGSAGSCGLRAGGPACSEQPLRFSQDAQQFDSEVLSPTSPADPSEGGAKGQAFPCVVPMSAIRQSAEICSAFLAAEELESLRDQGQKFFSVDFAALASDRMLQGIVLTTDYSGMGCPEEALQQLLKAVLVCTDRQGPEVPDTSACYSLRAGDMNKHCRCILMKHVGTFRPLCVHGDIMDRCGKKLRERMEHTRTTALGVVQKQIDDGKSKNSASVVEAGAGTCKGLRVHVAGVNCYDWSKMGSAHGWLGQGMPIFMQWARERMVSLEDLIIVECVPQFDSEMMGELFANHYNLDVLQFGPTLFGEPVERPRKYMILTRKDKLQWRAQIEDFGVQDAFFRIFARKVCMEGQCKFRAPDDYIESQLQDLARAQSLPPRSRSGKQWSFYQVASQAVRSSIDDHEAAVARRIGSDAVQTSWIANLRQSSTFMPAMQFTVPALLRTSRLWLCGKRRNALPLELLEVQGWNIWGSGGISRDTEVESEGMEPSLPDELRCGFVQHLHDLPSTQIFSMAGNSMHLRAIGATLLFCFGCTEPVSP
ncbi:unnamed protein product [Symbiodinium sp. KB8]|nr:unnamed protein product [Symbiodinium sp. KB8]